MPWIIYGYMRPFPQERISLPGEFETEQEARDAATKMIMNGQAPRPMEIVVEEVSVQSSEAP